MLFVAAEAVSGRYVRLESTPFAPPFSAGAMGADEYRGYLRALYRRRPEVFVHWSQCALATDETIVGEEGQVLVLYGMLVEVGRRRGWEIGGGLRRVVGRLRMSAR